ncbi:MAG: hypothetical protein AB7V14_06575, partial [Kiritimatiellia bacterium]
MIGRAFGRLVWLLVVAGALALAARMAWAGAPILGAVLALASLFAAWVYNSPRAHAARYLLPGLAAFAIFVLLPLLYTVYVAFTNFSGEHLLSQERVRAWFAQDVYAPDDARYPFRLHPAPEPGKYQIAIPMGQGEIGQNFLVSRPFTTNEAAAGRPVVLALNIVPPKAKPLGMRGVVAARPWLNHARFTPPGASTPLRLVGLRALGFRLPLWNEDGDNLVHAVTGQTLVPDPRRGNYVDERTRESVGPGWHVWIGTENFRLLFADPAIRKPFLQIFGWNVAFAFLSVALTFAIGVVLASLLQWKALRGRAIDRTLRILPDAM